MEWNLIIDDFIHKHGSSATSSVYHVLWVYCTILSVNGTFFFITSTYFQNGCLFNTKKMLFDPRSCGTPNMTCEICIYFEERNITAIYVTSAMRDSIENSNYFLLKYIQWNPWLQRDREFRFVFDGDCSGTGEQLYWDRELNSSQYCFYFSHRQLPV